LMSRYFAHNTASSPVRYGQYPFAIGVLEGLDKPMPMGMASECGCTEDGLAADNSQLRRARAMGDRRLGVQIG
jgi:hypothetical protein